MRLCWRPEPGLLYNWLAEDVLVIVEVVTVLQIVALVDVIHPIVSGLLSAKPHVSRHSTHSVNICANLPLHVTQVCFKLKLLPAETGHISSSLSCLYVAVFLVLLVSAQRLTQRNYFLLTFLLYIVQVSAVDWQSKVEIALSLFAKVVSLSLVFHDLGGDRSKPVLMGTACPHFEVANEKLLGVVKPSLLLKWLDCFPGLCWFGHTLFNVHRCDALLLLEHQGLERHLPRNSLLLLLLS